LIHLPRVGQILQVTLVSPTGEANEPTYRTRIAEISGHIAAIEIPIEESTGKFRRIPAGSQLHVCYQSEDGIRYDFRSELIGERKEQLVLQLITIPPANQIKRMQRRHYLRVNAAFDLAVKLNDNLRMYHFLTKTIDLSGGGLSFRCSTQFRLKQGDLLQLWLAMPSRVGHVEHVHTKAEVTRVELPAVNSPEAKQQVSVKFVDIAQGEQAKVVRACYEQQLHQRRKTSG